MYHIIIKLRKTNILKGNILYIKYFKNNLNRFDELKMLKINE